MFNPIWRSFYTDSYRYISYTPPPISQQLRPPYRTWALLLPDPSYQIHSVRSKSVTSYTQRCLPNLPRFSSPLRHQPTPTPISTSLWKTSLPRRVANGRLLRLRQAPNPAHNDQAVTAPSHLPKKAKQACSNAEHSTLEARKGDAHLELLQIRAKPKRSLPPMKAVVTTKRWK